MYCESCGTKMVGDGYPKTCPKCHHQKWRNPLPVGCLLQPVRRENGLTDQLLVGRRGESPGKGSLALISGYSEVPESWAAGIAREAREEVSLDVDPRQIEPFNLLSVDSGSYLLFFGIAPPIDHLRGLKTTREITELVVIDEASYRARIREFEFPLHKATIQKYFDCWTVINRLAVDYQLPLMKVFGKNISSHWSINAAVMK